MCKKIIRLRVLYGIILINACFVICSGSIIIFSMWINAERNARELSYALIKEIQSSVSSETIRYFFPGRAANRELAYLLYRFFDDPINNQNTRGIMFGYRASCKTDRYV